MYKIKLPNFEGPFDLLLYFIKRDELNIYDIPIAKITEEYLKYIRLMRYFDLELAGEFLVMASTLMYIKTQMLLPRPKDEEGERIEDPRTILVQKLIEYKQFKEASKELSEMQEEQRYVYYRNLFDGEKREGEEIYYENSTLFDLLSAFGKAMERSSGGAESHTVDLNPITIKEKAGLILRKLKKLKRFCFSDLVKGESKRGIVVSFLAMLDLMRTRAIYIRQEDTFEDIVISEAQLN